MLKSPSETPYMKHSNPTVGTYSGLGNPGEVGSGGERPVSGAGAREAPGVSKDSAPQ